MYSVDGFKGNLGFADTPKTFNNGPLTTIDTFVRGNRIQQSFKYLISPNESIVPPEWDLEEA